MPQLFPRIGVATFIYRYRQSDARPEFLLMKRTGSHGPGTWGLPGGAIDHGEEPNNAAYREVVEEIGVVGTPHKLEGLSSFVDEFGTHWITILYSSMISPWQEPTIREPQKCSGFAWATLDSMPSPLFGPLDIFLRHHQLDCLR